jgi:CMP-N,N'-diacetyllegionaminic acid synthase
MKKRIFVFDIDGTITKTPKGDYKKAKPIKSRIAKINKLYKEGNTIIFYTSRGYATGLNWEALTNYQLKKWKVGHHTVVFGKPYADVAVDDKAMNDKAFFKLK